MRRVGVVTLSQLGDDYRRARKEIKKTIVKEKKELRKRSISEEDQRAGSY